MKIYFKEHKSFFKTEKFLLTNQKLKELSLKSLIDIKTRFDNKHSKKRNTRKD
jgi:CMP-N-acetylneuraminic acid synthetase